MVVVAPIGAAAGAGTLRFFVAICSTPVYANMHKPNTPLVALTSPFMRHYINGKGDGGMEKETKRTGRPVKPVRAKRGRTRLSLVVTAETKRRINAATQDSGRSLSAEIELLIEQALTYATVLSAMNTSVQEIAKGKIEAEFRKAGYTAVHSPHGKIWLPPGYPIERGGFKAIEDKEK